MDQNYERKLMGNREYRDRFIKNPNSMLDELGLTELTGKKIIVHENTGTNINFTLIPKGVQINTSDIDERFIKIQEKAWEDDNFKTQLLTNTRETLIRTFGDLPEYMTIGIYENTADTVHLVLPVLEDSNDELNDNDLDMVSGGKSGPSLPSVPIGPVIVKPGLPGIPPSGPVRPIAPSNPGGPFGPPMTGPVTGPITNPFVPRFTGW